jgi:hypothetical protein
MSKKWKMKVIFISKYLNTFNIIVSIIDYQSCLIYDNIYYQMLIIKRLVKT